LDVSIVVQELDESVEAVEAVSDAVGNELSSFTLGFLKSAINVLKENSDHPDESQDEGSKSERSSVISYGPLESSPE